MLQPGEMLIILVIALIVLGPERLPVVAKKLGKWTSELRTAATEIRQGIEAEISDLKTPIDEMSDAFRATRDQIEEVGVSRLDWTGPKPVSGPTPDEAMADLDRIEALSRETDSDLAEEADERR